MEQNLKQRLVGALVLISLAVIFLPLVFDGQQPQVDTESYTIPEKPAISLKSVDIEPLEQQAAQELGQINAIREQKQEQEATAAQMAADAAAAQQPETPAASSAATSASSATTSSTTITPASLPAEAVAAHVEQEKKVDQTLQTAPQAQAVDLAEAWVIQVGAFSSQPNAEGLRDKLKAAGYPAFVKSLKVTSGNLFKVYVGPEIRRAMADRQKLELEQKYQLKALILKYIP